MAQVILNNEQKVRLNVALKAAQKQDMRGFACHAQELLDGKDPTGGMIDVGDQIATIEQSLVRSAAA